MRSHSKGEVLLPLEPTRTRRLIRAGSKSLRHPLCRALPCAPVRVDRANGDSALRRTIEGRHERGLCNDCGRPCCSARCGDCPGTHGLERTLQRPAIERDISALSCAPVRVEQSQPDSLRDSGWCCPRTVHRVWPDRTASGVPKVSPASSTPQHKRAGELTHGSGIRASKSPPSYEWSELGVSGHGGGRPIPTSPLP
jgi:hypothetical protein